MTWNYRVVKYNIDKNIIYRIHEVFYDKNKNMEGFTENAVSPQGDSLKELIADLQLMMDDAKKSPVLSLKELNEKFSKKLKNK